MKATKEVLVMVMVIVAVVVVAVWALQVSPDEYEGSLAAGVTAAVFVVALFFFGEAQLLRVFAYTLAVALVAGLLIAQFLPYGGPEWHVWFASFAPLGGFGISLTFADAFGWIEL